MSHGMRPATTPGARKRKTIVPIHARAGEAAWAMHVRLARFLIEATGFENGVVILRYEIKK
jgi:hypothetical protein